MTAENQLTQQLQENRDIVDSLIADGSDPHAEYTIEHHLSAANFDRLEKAAIDAFKLGFEVNDAEEMELDDGSVIFCFDAISHHALDIELLNKACEQLVHLAHKNQVNYDGWGTYFIDSEDNDSDNENNPTAMH